MKAVGGISDLMLSEFLFGYFAIGMEVYAPIPAHAGTAISSLVVSYLRQIPALPVNGPDIPIALAFAAHIGLCTVGCKDYPLSIRAPGWLNIDASRICQLNQIGTINVHHEQMHTSADWHRKNDSLAIRR